VKHQERDRPARSKDTPPNPTHIKFSYTEKGTAELASIDMDFLTIILQWQMLARVVALV
jgi:hypothetical protein